MKISVLFAYWRTLAALGIAQASLALLLPTMGGDAKIVGILAGYPEKFAIFALVKTSLLAQRRPKGMDMAEVKAPLRLAQRHSCGCSQDVAKAVENREIMPP